MTDWAGPTAHLTDRMRHHIAMQAAFVEAVAAAHTTPATTAVQVTDRLASLLALETEGDVHHVDAGGHVPAWVAMIHPADNETDRLVVVTATGERFLVTVTPAPPNGPCDACGLPAGVEDARYVLGVPGFYVHTRCPR